MPSANALAGHGSRRVVDMAKNLSSSQPITQVDFEEIQNYAKAAARLAIAINDPSRLTAVGRAYYEKFRKESGRLPLS